MFKNSHVALMDVEYIQTSQDHMCSRKIAILLADGKTSFIREYTPCTPYKYLDVKWQRTHHYCSRKIHHLGYYPKDGSFSCKESIQMIKDILEWNGVERVLYKGGDIERKICNQIGISSLNIEQFGAPKATSHDPLEELKEHYIYLKQNVSVLF